MSRETGLVIGIVATAVGFLFGNLWLMMAGGVVILMETTSDS